MNNLQNKIPSKNTISQTKVPEKYHNDTKLIYAIVVVIEFEFSSIYLVLDVV